MTAAWGSPVYLDQQIRQRERTQPEPNGERA